MAKVSTPKPMAIKPMSTGPAYKAPKISRMGKDTTRQDVDRLAASSKRVARGKGLYNG